MLSEEEHEVLHKLNSAATLIQRTTTEAPRDHMYYIGLDVHKRTISYCVKDAAGRVHLEGKSVPQGVTWITGLEIFPNSGCSRWKRRSLPGGSMITCFPVPKR